VLAGLSAVVMPVVGWANLDANWHGLLDRSGTWVSLVLLAAGLIALPLIPVAVVRWRRAARDPHSACPHCRKSLSTAIPLVTASRRCPHCGGAVLPDPDDAPTDATGPAAPPPPRPTRWEFLEADKRHQGLGIPVLIGGLIGSYVGCGGAAAASQALRLPDPLGIVVFGLLAAVVPVSAVLVLASLYFRAKRNDALTCSHCKAVLAGHRSTVAATGRCVRCGRTALGPRHRPLPPPHAARPFTVARITELENARWLVTLRNGRRVLWVLAAAVALIAAPYAIAGSRTGVELWLSPRVGDTWAGLIADGGPWVTLFVVLMGVAVVSGWATTRMKKRHPLDCPRCGKKFLPAFARATGCCHHCYRPIMQDSLTVQSTFPPGVQ
jgi:ribosomal protein L37AE/L43A